MKTILVCNQKGGVGKSFLADELAFSFERSQVPVSFFDLDAQGGTIHHTHESEGAEVSIVDTPGALQEKLADWIEAADVIVIPTRASSRDIPPLRTMRDAVIRHSRKDAKIIYIFNGYNGRYRASQDFDEFFHILAGDDATVCRIPQSEQVVQAGALSKSVVEYAPRANIAIAVKEAVNQIREAAGFDAES